MKYLFTYEPEKTTIAFTDFAGHKSGIVMKAIDYVQPDVIEKLQASLAERPAKVGDVIYIKTFAFVVSRRHYASRHDINAILAALSSMDGQLKISTEEYPEIIDLLRDKPEVELYDTSTWINPKKKK